MLAKKLKIVYVTCCENGFFALRYLNKKGFNIEKVITIDQTLGKKYEVSGYYNPEPWCKSVGIPVLNLQNYSVKKIDVKDTSKEILIVNGWNRLIEVEIINEFKIGALGVHAGHPPIGLGRAPLPWNIIKGFRDIEVYIFRLTKNADDGDILAIHPVEITLQDTIRTLYEKVMFQSAKLFEKAIFKLIDQKVGFKQAKKFQITYPKRIPSDGQIDFKKSVTEIIDLIRSQSRPYPGAFSFLDNEKWYIWKAQPFDTFAFRNKTRIPGQIILALPSGVVVQTGSAALWITEATKSNKTMIPTHLFKLETYVDKIFKNVELE